MLEMFNKLDDGVSCTQIKFADDTKQVGMWTLQKEELYRLEEWTN